MVTIRVVLADDHPVLREGVRALLERTCDLAVVGEASDGAEALRLATELRPDVLVLDVEMPGLTGDAVARQLRAAGAPVKILALSAHDDEAYVRGLLASGAPGYLLKDEARQTIVEAVRGVARGEEGWLSRRITAQVLRRGQLATPPPPHPAALLSPREREVLTLMAYGQSNEEIAAALCLSEGTVKNHVVAIYSKVGVRTRAKAVAWAWQQGLMGEASGPRS